MRSRYSAFAKRLPDYLLDTWHPSTRPASLDLQPVRRWTALRVLAVDAGEAGDEFGTVEFEADHVSPTGTGTLHERSRFERFDGRWVYRSGVARP